MLRPIVYDLVRYAALLAEEAPKHLSGATMFAGALAACASKLVSKAAEGDCAFTADKIFVPISLTAK